jgi:hypothetical protein
MVNLKSETVIALLLEFLEVERHWNGLSELPPPVVELLLRQFELPLKDFKGIRRSHSKAHPLKRFDHSWQFGFNVGARRMNVMVFELIAANYHLPFPFSIYSVQ